MQYQLQKDSQSCLVSLLVPKYFAESPLFLQFLKIEFELFRNRTGLIFLNSVM